MKVHFRTYCYGCRRGRNWNGKCLWREHRYDWEYYIECSGRRLVQRQSFKTFDRAWRSAERSWFKLLTTECINEP
jgi:hypothetical protein